MHDVRNKSEDYQAWLDAVNKLWEQNWRCESGWIFIAPSGTRHDLSAADLRQLWLIEQEGLFFVQR
jgi:hypothetical protein